MCAYLETYLYCYWGYHSDCSAVRHIENLKTPLEMCTELRNLTE
jgi:hypothetical protein